MVRLGASRTLQLALLTMVLALAVQPLAAAADVTVTVHVGTTPGASQSSAHYYYVSPEHITVNKGDKVTMTVINDDVSNGQVTTPHDLSIFAPFGEKPNPSQEDQACHATTAGSEDFGWKKVSFETCDTPTDTKTFTASTAGLFVMACEVSGHLDHGMYGTLEVQGTNSSSLLPFPSMGLWLPLVALGALLMAYRQRKRS